MHDVLIVGAGPAGTAAAIRLAEAGHRVALVERDRVPRAKPCGELLLPRAVDAAAALGVPAEPLGHRIAQLRITHAGGDGARRRASAAEWPTGSVAFVAPRDRFDTALVDRAVAAGTELFAEHTAVAPIVNRGFVRGARVAGPSGTVELAAAYTLVADGANSRFGRALGTFREPTWPHALAHRARYPSALHAATEAELVVGLRDHAGVPVTGYAWMFPRGDGTVNIGVTVLSTSASFQVINPVRLLDAVVAEFTDEWRLEGEPVEPPAGGRIPMGASVGPLAGPTYLVAGDAGGMANPISATGIEYALDTGMLAAEVLTEALATGSAAALQRYPRMLEDRHGTYFKVGRLACRLVGNPTVNRRAARIASARRASADAFVRLAANQLRPGWGGAELLYRAGRAIAKVAPSA